MARKTASADLRSLIGDPQQVANDLRRFRRTTRVLSSDRPRLIAEYPKRWVALYDGEVAATSRTFTSLLKSLDRKHLPREHVVIRYIDEDERIMIL
jgi:hypothetical protein